VLAPYVNDDTFAAAYINAGSLKVSDASSAFEKFLPMLGDGAQPAMLGMMMADGVVQRFQAAGGEAIYVVAGLSDLPGNGPLGIATTRPGQDPAKVEQLFRALLLELGSMAGMPPGTPNAPEIVVVRRGDLVLIGLKPTVARYSSLKPSPRPELVDPLTKLSSDGAVIAGVFCPGSDFRRVVRELWPQLPGVLAPMRGELADRWISLEFAANAPPDPRPRLALQAKDAEAAELFAKLWQDLPTAVTEFGGNEASRNDAKRYAQQLVDTLPAKVEGPRVTMDLSIGDTQAAKLQAMFAEATGQTMESSRRRQRMNNFKQLALAMHLYADQQKHLPPAAISGQDGKPLLGWRVAVLPFLDQLELYKQFHLDEPWDSPHNKKLIEKMPEVFADPDPKVRRAVGAGRTTCQVPTGPETVFHNSEGTKFSDITDGTSVTLMLVDAAPTNAIEWTKPADWEVDFTQPLKGLKDVGREYFVAARCDGSAHVVPMDIAPETLKALITRAGGELIDE
jgi:hypothetical protein